MANICFVTGNEKKLKECREIIGNEKLKSIKLDLPELQGADVQEIASEKCKIAWGKVKDDKDIDAIFTEDTSLPFNALKGMPGPYIKWHLESTGNEGLWNSLAAYTDKSAEAVCCVSYMNRMLEKPMTFVGSVSGTIVSPQGPKTAFGWDPVFKPDGFKKTFAEMTSDEKNAVSHRRRALEKLRDYLNSKNQKVMYFVTGNKRKLDECRSILHRGDELQSIKIDLPELQGENVVEIAKEKCLLAWKEARKVDSCAEAIFTEDTSLGFDALNGLPGPYVKWFFDSCGNKNMVHMIDSFKEKGGKAICCVSFMDSTLVEPVTFVGEVEGCIVEPRGPDTAFGWDPIFEVEVEDPTTSKMVKKTFAELTPEEKNQHSHRKRALEKLRDYINQRDGSTEEPSAKRRKT